MQTKYIYIYIHTYIHASVTTTYIHICTHQNIQANYKQAYMPMNKNTLSHIHTNKHPTSFNL